jgi:hypothetical protein
MPTSSDRESLLLELEPQWTKQWLELVENPAFDISAWIRFSEVMQDLGKRHHFRPLVFFGERIEKEASHCDILALSETVRIFPDLILNIKSERTP